MEEDLSFDSHSESSESDTQAYQPDASGGQYAAEHGGEEEIVFSRRRGRPRKYPPGTSDTEARKIRAAMNQGMDFRRPEFFVPAVQEFSIRTRRQLQDTPAIPASMISPAAKIAEIRGGYVVKNALRAAMDADETFSAAFPVVELNIPEGVKLRPVRVRDPDLKPLGRPPKKSRHETGDAPGDSAEAAASEPPSFEPASETPNVEASDAPKAESAAEDSADAPAAADFLGETESEAVDPPLVLAEPKEPAVASPVAMRRSTKVASTLGNFLPLD